MKKLIAVTAATAFLLPVASFVSVPQAYAATTIFSEDFGTGSTISDIPGWSDPDAEAVAPGGGEDYASPDGGRFAKIAEDGIIDGYICAEIDATGYSDLQLSYYWNGDDDSVGEGDEGVVEYGTTGSCSSSDGWSNLKTHDLSDGASPSWFTQSAFSLPSGLDDQEFFLRFRADVSASNEYFRVDGIEITGEEPTGTLTVTKVVVNDNAGTAVVGDFTLYIDAATTTSGAANVLPTGTYTVSEDALAGYASSSFSGDCDSSGMVTLGSGDDLECIITNDDDPVSPIITPLVTPAPNGNGWNNTNPVTVSWTVDGAGLSIDSSTGCDPFDVTGETAGTDVTCEATNAAGTSSSTVTIKIDMTAPEITIGSPIAGATYDTGGPELADWSATDALSGIDTATAPAASGDPIGAAFLPGENDFIVEATDLAGNSASDSVHISVIGGGGGGGGTPAVLGASDENTGGASDEEQQKEEQMMDEEMMEEIQEGEVLGETTCSAYLTSYLFFGADDNDSTEVMKLQDFLNRHLGLSLPTSGTYDELTRDAVSVFQLQNYGEILAPWVSLGLLEPNTPTGDVYKTTQWKINMFECPSLDLPAPQIP